MFAFRQDGGDYLRGLVLTEGLETIFQLRKTHRKKEREERENVSVYKGRHSLNAFSWCGSGSVTFTGISKGLSSVRFCVGVVDIVWHPLEIENMLRCFYRSQCLQPFEGDKLLFFLCEHGINPRLLLLVGKI